MSQDDVNERTEQATPKRESDAKARGQVARSRDLNSWIVMFVGAMSFLVFGKYIYGKIQDLFVHFLSFDSSTLLKQQSLPLLLNQGMTKGFSILCPLFIFVFISGILGAIVMGGWTFTLGNVAFKLERLDPIKGFFKIFSLKSFVELVKSILKMTLVVALSYVVFRVFFGKIILLSHLNPMQGIGESLNIIFWSFIILSISLFLVCLFDVPYQIWEYRQQLMMSKQEIKDEYKETEGKPEVKSKISRLQRELSRRRMMAALETADVIITNPTHFAVALKYDDKKMRAPLVVAKGADLIAHRMIELGTKHDIPLISMPPLARTLFHYTEIGDEIPSKLYMAVAQVLAYIYQLKQYRKGKMKKPKLPDKLDIPDEMTR